MLIEGNLMSKARSRAAVAPLRRSGLALVDDLPSVDALTAVLRPVEPMYCVRPRTLAATAQRFVAGFPGDVLYAVKCNPEPSVLRALWRGGIRHFDCASPGEIRLVRQLFPAAAIHYMHPIKPESAIRQAYTDCGVRDFSLDSMDELNKIVAVTRGAPDLGLHIRLALPKGNAVYDLSGKFGAAPDEAVQLLRAARQVAQTVGICFHVGSQCLEPEAYGRAIALAGAVIREAGVEIDRIDVGGGFPASYPGSTPPDLSLYFDEIEASFQALDLPETCRLWCEPGRALVAGGASIVVRVEARRGDVLHINDGVYGNLSDAGGPKWRFPVRLIRCDSDESTEDVRPFSFYGPTCDSADFMTGPFSLPGDAMVGDWIEIGQLGAYGTCLRTAFNGFDRTIVTEVADSPLLATPGHLGA